MLTDLPHPTVPIEAVVVGASAGAVEALSVVLPAFPKSAHVAVIVCVHLPANRPSILGELFARRCALPIREPQDKLPIGHGAIWFAPPNYHLLVERDRSFGLSVDEPENWSRPSIDVLFETAAEAYGPALVGVVLTGANADGARGARAIRRAGGIVMVQDPKTAEATYMPMAAIEQADPHVIAPLAKIASLLRGLSVSEGT